MLDTVLGVPLWAHVLDIEVVKEWFCVHLSEGRSPENLGTWSSGTLERDPFVRDNVGQGASDPCGRGG
jgi:hypothetical protein